MQKIMYYDEYRETGNVTQLDGGIRLFCARCCTMLLMDAISKWQKPGIALLGTLPRSYEYEGFSACLGQDPKPQGSGQQSYS